MHVYVHIRQINTTVQINKRKCTLVQCTYEPELKSEENFLFVVCGVCIYIDFDLKPRNKVRI